MRPGVAGRIGLQAYDGVGAVVDGMAEGVLPVESAGEDIRLMKAYEAGSTREPVEHLVYVAGLSDGKGAGSTPGPDGFEVLGPVELDGDGAARGCEDPICTIGAPVTWIRDVGPVMGEIVGRFLKIAVDGPLSLMFASWAPGSAAYGVQRCLEIVLAQVASEGALIMRVESYGTRIPS